MLRNYLKMAWKVLGRRKFFTFVSLLGISFTLMSMLVVVALADHFLMPSYPEVQLDRMLVLDRMSMSGDRSNWNSGPGYKFLDVYARDLPGIEGMSVISNSSDAVSFKNGRKEVYSTRYTDAEFWNVMQFSFVEGAAFTHENDVNANRVAVISEAARLRFFGEEPGLGKTIELDATEYRVIGVVQDVPFYRVNSAAHVWLPLHTNSSAGFFDRLMGGCFAAYVLSPDADPTEVKAAFAERLTRVQFDEPERYHTMTGMPMSSWESLASSMLNMEPGETAPRTMLLLTIVAGLAFMILPAINLVNINLSRIYERSSEIGVRKAFGAAGRDLVLQFVVENIFLSLLGGVIGLLGAYLVLHGITLLPQLPFFAVSLSWRVFAGALALATLFGLLSGAWPAWKMSRQHPVVALRGGAS
jgi:putative ABC transport system permease protein